MKLHSGFFLLLMELCSRMTSLLCLLILFGLVVASPLGLEDVFFSPQDQTIREGEAVFFQCVSGESSPPANITWLKDGEEVMRGKQFQGEYGGGQQKKTSGTLHIFNVTLKDDGIYVCVTLNSLLNISKKSKPAKLTVQGVPTRLHIIQGPENITVVMGTQVSMQCSVRGFPVPMVHWFKDGCLLSNCSASFSLQNNGQLLTFRNVTKGDEGSYHCEASNQKETIRSQPAFLLTAEMHWSFVQQPTNLTVNRGENVVVTCRPPHSRPEAQVSWFKNNQPLPPTSNITVLPNGDLFFLSIQEHDSGSYFCRASNTQLQRFLTSGRATLTVLAPPSVKLRPTVLTVPVGARAVLECEVSGHPLPSIRWVKRGHSKQTGGKIALGQRNATLYIQSARSYDEAVYVCEASNKLGRSQSSAVLRVAVSPIIVTSINQVSCRIGALVVLPCRAVGILPIVYSWTRGGAETPSSISHSEDKHVDEDGALHISSVQHSDAGEYFCTVENRAGRHQRRTVLTVTAEDHPAVKGGQTGLVLSASNNTSEKQVISQSMGSMAERNLKTPHFLLGQQRLTTSESSSCKTTTTSPTGSRKVLTEPKRPTRPPRVLQPATNPSQLFVTHMQPPILPPPPHPNFQSVDLDHQLSLTRNQLLISNIQPPVTQSPTSAGAREHLSPILDYLSPSSHTQFHHELSKEGFLASGSQHSRVHTSSLEGQIGEMFKSQPSSKLPVIQPSGSFESESYMPTATQLSDTVDAVSQANMRHSVTLRVTPEQQSQQSKSHPPQQTKSLFSHQKTFSQISQMEQTHLLPSFLSQTSQTLHHQPVTLSFSPKFHLELSTLQRPTTPPPSSLTEPQLFQLYSSTSKTTSRPGSSPQQHPALLFSTISPHDPGSSTLDPEVHWSNQHNATQPPNNKDWSKRNTSQSPMTSNNPKGTQQSPSWLPILEKHDIPIVVGVGVSLAFIFITVTFYSVVQKNEPTPTGRAAQRNFGVPTRHADRRAAGRTYENRAFEDDDCVTVIEQSPNTSDTRARPPRPSLVTVQMEPTFEEVQETQTAADQHSVTVEAYPEPFVDTKIDPSLEEDKRCSLSQPSIQLQCAEDWTSYVGDNHSPCQDPLPPPSALSSPSPSLPLRRDDTLHSSLTFRSAEPSAAPIHHSLSISHGNPPLLLSHHLSLGLTTVAVDVQFCPSASASMTVSSSTHISSVSDSTSVTAPLCSPLLVNSQENDDRSTARFHQSK